MKTEYVPQQLFDNVIRDYRDGTNRCFDAVWDRIKQLEFTLEHLSTEHRTLNTALQALSTAQLATKNESPATEPSNPSYATVCAVVTEMIERQQEQGKSLGELKAQHKSLTEGVAHILEGQIIQLEILEKLQSAVDKLEKFPPQVDPFTTSSSAKPVVPQPKSKDEYAENTINY